MKRNPRGDEENRNTSMYTRKRNMIRIYLLSVFILHTFSVCTAQSFDARLSEKLQHALDSTREAHGLKGVSAAVYHPDQGIWSGASGISHASTPISTDMRFGIGSNTKTFIATLLLRLAEQSVLTLDDSLHQWLPSYPHVDSSISIRQLLNHTSGVKDYSANPAYRDSILDDHNRIWSPIELIEFIGPPDFSPGQDWKYSNSNYLLAGMLIQQVTGGTLASALRSLVLDPLQLNATVLAVEEALPGPVAHPWNNGINIFNIPRNSRYSAAWAAGAMFSTANEMVLWYRDLMDAKILSRNSLSEMTNFTGNRNYGLGISEQILANRTVWGHSGAIAGYTSIALHDPLLRLSLSVLVNQSSAPAAALAAVLLNAIVKFPTLAVTEHADIAPTLCIHPNPLREQAYISVHPPFPGAWEFTVYDAYGRVVRKERHENIASLSFKRSELPTGLYFFHFHTASGNSRVTTVIIE